jgi:hypothetical protein
MAETKTLKQDLENNVLGSYYQETIYYKIAGFSAWR